MWKTLRGHCNVGYKSSVGDGVTTKVAITVGVGKSSSSLESIHYGWRQLSPQRRKWVVLWLRRPMREKRCLPQSGHWWSESWIGQSTGACWCLRLCLRAAVRSYSASEHDIPKALVDLQVALFVARGSSLLKGMLHILRIDLLWSFKRFFCPPTLLWPSHRWP